MRFIRDIISERRSAKTAPPPPVPAEHGEESMGRPRPDVNLSISASDLARDAEMNAAEDAGDGAAAGHESHDRLGVLTLGAAPDKLAEVEAAADAAAAADGVDAAWALDDVENQGAETARAADTVEADDEGIVGDIAADDGAEAAADAAEEIAADAAADAADDAGDESAPDLLAPDSVEDGIAGLVSEVSAEADADAGAMAEPAGEPAEDDALLAVAEDADDAPAEDPAEPAAAAATHHETPLDRIRALRAAEAEADTEVSARPQTRIPAFAGAASAVDTAPLGGQDPAPDLAEMPYFTVPEPGTPGVEADDPAGSSDDIQVPPPAAGRGSAGSGRVKTRLLGFNPAGLGVTDPFEKAVSSQKNRDFPVAWLVVVSGPGRGASFALHDGVSRIGRAADQSVPLTFGDTAISRENHSSIAYDPEENAFYIGQSGKANIVRLNNKPLLSTEQLQSGDQIRLGETTLRFVALCDEDFRWSDGA